MNNREKKPDSKSRNVDLFKNYVKPSKSKAVPNVIALLKPNNFNENENRRTEEKSREERKVNDNFQSIPECLRLGFNIQPDEVEEMDVRNIRNRKDPDILNQFEYIFYKRENYDDKEVELLRSYLDNHNQHKYREFKKMLEGKSCARPIGNIFICGEIDVDKHIKKMRAEKAKFVENIKESANKSRFFKDTNDNIPEIRNRNILNNMNVNMNMNMNVNNNPSQKISDSQNDKNSSQSKIFHKIQINFLIYRM
jgi:hypothetical protein